MSEVTDDNKRWILSSDQAWWVNRKRSQEFVAVTEKEVAKWAGELMMRNYGPQAEEEFPELSKHTPSGQHLMSCMSLVRTMLFSVNHYNQNSRVIQGQAVWDYYDSDIKDQDGFRYVPELNGWPRPEGARLTGYGTEYPKAALTK